MLYALNEGTAARRRVPFRLFTSNGTSPDTSASSDSVILAINSLTTFVPNSTVSVTHAPNGMYYVELSQSNLSVLGTHALYHVQGSFPQHVANIQVVNFNPYSTQSNDLSLRPTVAGRTLDVTATGEAGIDWANIGGPTTEQNLSGTSIIGVTRLNSNVTLRAVTHSGATIQGLSNYANISNVTLHAGTHTGAVIPTVTAVTNQVTADVTGISGDATAADNLEAAFDGTGYDSGLTVFVKDSIATIAGVTNTATLINALNDIDGSAVTLHPGTHSDVTIQGVTNLSGIVSGTITSSAYAAGAIDAAALADDAGHEIADQILDRNIAGGSDGGRDVTSALRALRNRVQADNSVLTVYQENDTASAWTASITTVDDPSNIFHINPL